jgi:hypothetical protein
LLVAQQATLLDQHKTRVQARGASQPFEVSNVGRNDDSILPVPARENRRVARFEETAIPNVDRVDTLGLQTNRYQRG